MRITYKARFVIGIIDLVVGVACVMNRGTTVLAFIPIICGVASLIQSIETKAQRRKRKDNIEDIAKEAKE